MRRRLRLDRLARQAHGEGGAEAAVAVDGDGAAVRLYDLTHDPQTEAEAAEMLQRRHPLEALEDAPLRLLGDADAVIGDANQRLLFVAADLDLDGPPVAVLDGVAHQVLDDLLDTQRVPASAHRAAAGAQRQRRAGAVGGLAQALQHLL